MDEKKKISDDADALYTAVAQASRDDAGANTGLFSQERLLELSGLSDMKQLLLLVQSLTNQNLLRTLKQKGKLVWGPRPREAARQMISLDQNDRMIYETIEESHVNGVWSRAIRAKTSIAQNAVTKSLGKLEKMNMIKSIKSVKNPAQRTYILYHLVPSEDVTGNSFFDAGDLDESFRDELMNLIVFWVRSQSWADEKKTNKRKRNGDGNAPASPANRKKRKRIDDIEDAGPKLFRVGDHEYPTVETIHAFLISCDVIHASKRASLTVQEIQVCIDVLIWDGKLERILNTSELGYRTVRGVMPKLARALDEDEEIQGTGLTQAPCGRCPVFTLCHKDSVINPACCVYYDQWLEE